MEINAADYEKLGAFYLGREYDVANRRLEDRLVLYDSRDLVTHGVVLGMTGSGKTGLCIALLEEAAIDGIPAIVIDPKGDIANLLLTFPGLDADSFRPWINEEDARRKGKSPEEFAAAQAEMWAAGLAEWGQGPDRIRALRDAVDMTIYTPGSNAGIPVSILSSLEAPPFEVVDDAELFSERIESTASSILGLLNISADPISSREHILLSSIFNHAWRKGEDLSLESIIGYVQQPPFAKVGVIDVETFFPEKRRTELARAINNLLAAPGFSTWLAGEPLDIRRMLHTPDGKPRVSIFSISHLGDSERMFFVSLLLNQMVGWMRSQSGTTSLRALLYMDEIFGFLPPTQNPPSKKPMMILLKQSRAFGLGLLLATQNPVDLDYKALSNTGTWFLGRLQTERDKARVLDGLEGAASSQGGKFDRASLDRMLAALGNRVFLMNNVHEDQPVVLHVRWVMSYLRGPLTRTQIRTLMDPKRAADGRNSGQPAAPAPTAPAVATAPAPAAAAREKTATVPSAGRPALPSRVHEYFFPVNSPSAAPMPVIYRPHLIRAAEIHFLDAAKGVNVRRRVTFLDPLEPDMAAPDFGHTHRVDVDAASLQRNPDPEAGYAELPAFALQSVTYTTARDRTIEWLYHHETIDLLYSERLNLWSRPGESEGDFRARLAHAGHESRDREIAELREKFAAKVRALEAERSRAEAAVERERAQARVAQVSTVVSVGQTILGALFGRKRISAGTVSRGATAARGATRAVKESGDVARAEARLADVERELADLHTEISRRVDALRSLAGSGSEPLLTVSIRPMKKNIAMLAWGLAWQPFYVAGDGITEPAWEP